MSNPLDDRLLALTAIITVAYQFAFFLVTYALRFDKLTDFAGSTNFILLAVVTLVVGGRYEPRQVVLTTCVIVWGLRLCGFLLYRILVWGEDNRFDDKRENLPRLAAFWAIQALWAWTVSLTVTIVNSKNQDMSLNALDYIGWIIFAIGALLEATADQQKLFYKQKPESRGRWMDVGVWSWSRHPNYFGEMLVWTGIYMSAINSLEGAEHAAVVSPIFIILLLMFVSGIPIQEQGWDRKYGRKEGYSEFKNRTSVLIPIPPSLYERVPNFIKTTALLDFKLYNPGPADAENEKLRNGSPTENSGLMADQGKKAEAGNGEQV